MADTEQQIERPPLVELIRSLVIADRQMRSDEDDRAEVWDIIALAILANPDVVLLAIGDLNARIIDCHDRTAMDADDLREALDPIGHCDREWPEGSPHHWEMEA